MNKFFWDYRKVEHDEKLARFLAIIDGDIVNGGSSYDLNGKTKQIFPSLIFPV